MELTHTDDEVKKLVAAGGEQHPAPYVNMKIADLTMDVICPKQVNQISGYLNTWHRVSLGDKRRVVNLMITSTAAKSEALTLHGKSDGRRTTRQTVTLCSPL